MKFQFAKVILPIELGGYHESYAGQLLQVWVNPPREKKREREMLIAEYSKVLAPVISGQKAEGSEQDQIDAVNAINQKVFAWMAEIWSQHEDVESHWNVEEICTVYDADPTFYAWMTRHTIDLMTEFRAGQKKA